MVMNKEILLVAETVSNEKGVAKEVIFQAIEAALEMATRKLHGQDLEVKVVVNRQNGDYITTRIYRVVADEEIIENPAVQIPLSEARKKNADLNVGDIIEETMDSVEFGRIAAQSSKQVIVQKVREAERAQIVN